MLGMFGSSFFFSTIRKKCKHQAFCRPACDYRTTTSTTTTTALKKVILFLWALPIVYICAINCVFFSSRSSPIWYRRIEWLMCLTCFHFTILKTLRSWHFYIGIRCFCFLQNATKPTNIVCLFLCFILSSESDDN